MPTPDGQSTTDRPAATLRSAPPAFGAASTPGQPMPEFMESLPRDELAALHSHVAAGVRHAGRADQCVTDGTNPGRRWVSDLLTHLEAALRELSAARAIVAGRMEEPVTR